MDDSNPFSGTGASAGHGSGPRRPAMQHSHISMSWWQKAIIGVLLLALGYFVYVWDIVRIVVPQNHVMVLI
jgi:hypothetical protein